MEKKEKIGEGSMKRFLPLFLVSSFIIFVLPSLSFSLTRGIRVTPKQGNSFHLYKDYSALVVGVSDYEKWPKLPKAVDDAKEVASKLKELGFEVKLVLDPSYQEFKTALSDLVYEIGAEENRAVLFYYAGHGETETLADGTKMGYIIPRDCPNLKKDPKTFANQAISMRDIESVSLRILSKHLLMLFDSCFSGSLFNLVRAAPDDITEKSGMPVRQYITAGREDESVPDRSMFKRCLLIGLDGDADLTGDGYITGSELGMYLSEKVVNYTRRQQHPQYGKINNPSLDRGDFIFVPPQLRQKEEEAEKRRQEEKNAIADELKRMREEMKKSKEKVEQMKRVLEAKVAEEQIGREAAEKKKLEEEIRKLRAEIDKNSLTLDELKAKPAPEKRLASIPEEFKRNLKKLRAGKAPFMIDDFEDRDLWSVHVLDKWREKSDGKGRLKVSADPTQGANGTSTSMKMEYELLDERSAVSVRIGRGWGAYKQRVEEDTAKVRHFEKFNKIVFYLKGEKRKSFFSTPNRIIVQICCYGDKIKSRFGKYANYHNQMTIRPGQEWQKVEIPFDDFAPSPWTKDCVFNYPPKPDLRNILNICLMFSSYQADGGYADSNTVWIDEILLE